MPKLRIEEAAARRQARVDRGEETIVGVNRYRPAKPDEVPVLDIDNARVRQGQVERLTRIRAARDEHRVAATLDAVTKAAESGGGNLLALSIEAARARATVGEISAAMEKAWGRYQATIRSIA